MKLKGISLSGDKTTITSFSGCFFVPNAVEKVVRKGVRPKGNIFQGRFLQFVELNEYVLIDSVPYKGGTLLSQRALKLRRTKYDLAASEKRTPSFIAIRSP
ncbi:hypothetical protein MTR67_013443 [Solanum verrucosum]|uniref:Uncharacterized protein n=1 Tax=Solanum verrucosum TaxID=315347 RepID=A0AAF0QCI5_SOLVR|nr:hypothetical protein MTR67_013443 [Solanum verrucosum]